MIRHFQRIRLIPKKSKVKKSVYKKTASTQRLDFFSNDVIPATTNIAAHEEVVLEQRTYTLILIEKDLFGDCGVLRINGSLGSHRGHMRRDTCKDSETARKHFDSLVKIRLKRHYEPVN